MEIACDESGSEGPKLIGATTDVFAHASVCFDPDSAAACLRDIRARAPTLAREYKANHILREKNAAALTWLLDESGPLRGNAHVFLVDKAFFLVTKLCDDDIPRAREWYRTTMDQEFLIAANDRLRASVPKVTLDPLIPAIVAAVRYWGATELVHDQHNVLDEDTITSIKQATGLTSITLVDSRDDPRIQIADVLAGVARKIASDVLNRRGDPELAALLRPFVDPTSIWANQPL